MWLDPSTAPQTVLVYEELPTPPTPPTPPTSPGASGGGKGGGKGGGASGGDAMCQVSDQVSDQVSRTPLQRLPLEAVARGVLDRLKREGRPYAAHTARTTKG